MKKKITVLTLCAMLFALCSSAEAQQPKNTRREFLIADLVENDQRQLEFYARISSGDINGQGQYRCL